MMTTGGSHLGAIEATEIDHTRRGAATSVMTVNTAGVGEIKTAIDDQETAMMTTVRIVDVTEGDLLDRGASQVPRGMIGTETLVFIETGHAAVPRRKGPKKGGTMTASSRSVMTKAAATEIETT